MQNNLHIQFLTNLGAEIIWNWSLLFHVILTILFKRIKLNGINHYHKEQ